MTSEERKMILERSLKKIDRLKEKIQHLEEVTAPVSPENSIGRISRMDAINNKAVSEAALREARREMQDLEYAVRRIDDPEFGVCRNCGSKIAVKRLLFMPGSKQCMSCAR